MTSEETEARGTTSGVQVEASLRANSANGLSWLKLSRGQLLTSAVLYNHLYWLFVEDSLKVIFLSALHFSLPPSLPLFLVSFSISPEVQLPFFSAYH